MAQSTRYMTDLLSQLVTRRSLAYATSMGQSTHSPCCWGNVGRVAVVRWFTASTDYYCCAHMSVRGARIAHPRARVDAGSTSSTTRSWTWRSAARPSWRPSRSACSAPPTASSAQTGRPRRGSRWTQLCRRSLWTPFERAARQSSGLAASIQRRTASTASSSSSRQQQRARLAQRRAGSRIRPRARRSQHSSSEAACMYSPQGLNAHHRGQIAASWLLGIEIEIETRE